MWKRSLQIERACDMPRAIEQLVFGGLHWARRQGYPNLGTDPAFPERKGYYWKRAVDHYGNTGREKFRVEPALDLVVLRTSKQALERERVFFGLSLLYS